MTTVKMARLDTRLSIEHKILFEKAALLRGFKSLSDYVVTTMVTHSVIDIERYEPYSKADNARIREILSEATELSPSFLKSSKKLKDAISDSTLEQEAQ
jgi:uncharacterized protein (DUF1778 family)